MRPITPCRVVADARILHLGFPQAHGRDDPIRKAWTGSPASCVGSGGDGQWRLVYSDLIHPTAVIDPEATIAPDVQIGPYAVIEGPVQIGPGCVIEAHACLCGPLVMGRDNFVGHGAVLGKGPQHKGYRGEPTGLEIGDDNIFREFVTIHRGTMQGNGVTMVGNRNMFMVGSHLGHDVRVGNGCTVVNNALVAGHVTLDDECILSGNTAVQQRVRVGRLAMLGGTGGTTKDIPPFILQQGYNCVTGLNIVGLRRAGFSRRTDRRPPTGLPDPLPRGPARSPRPSIASRPISDTCPKSSNYLLRAADQDRHQPGAVHRAGKLRAQLSRRDSPCRDTGRIATIQFAGPVRRPRHVIRRLAATLGDGPIPTPDSLPNASVFLFVELTRGAGLVE